MFWQILWRISKDYCSTSEVGLETLIVWNCLDRIFCCPDTSGCINICSVLHSYLLTNLSLHHHWTISGFTFSLTTNNKRDALVLILINFPWFRLTRASWRAGRGRGGMQPYSKSFISAPIIGSVPTQTCCKGFILIHSYHNLSANNYSSWCHLNIAFVEHD